MPGLSKVIVLDPDARASRQVQLGFEREGIPTAAIAGEAASELPDDIGLVVVGGADGRGAERIRLTRSWLDERGVDAPIVFAGRGVAWQDATSAGADEVVRHPAYLRDVVTIGRLLRGLPAGRRDHIVGNLIEVTGVFTLVRALSTLCRSATLTLVRGLRRGEVRFYLGEVTSAQVGMIHGQAALHQLLLWTDARFDYHHEDVVRRQQIPLSPDELFADAERFLEGVRESSGGLSPAMVLEQNVERIQSLGAQIPTEVYGVLRMFDGHRALADVLEDSAYRVFETLRVAQRAVDAGLVRVVASQPRRPAWRPVLAIEDWLVGGTPREAAAAPAPLRRETGPITVRDARAAEAQQAKLSRKRRKKRRRPDPPAASADGATSNGAATAGAGARAATAAEIDWGALVPRIVGAEVGPLAGVVPASHVSGEIVERGDGEAPRPEPAAIADEPSIVFDEAAELAEIERAAAERAAADAERAEAERRAAQAQRVAAERAEAERLAAAAEAERAEAERVAAEAQRLAAEYAETERLAAEARAAAEAERAAAAAIARAEAERAEAERLAAEARAAEAQRLEADRAEAERRAAEARAAAEAQRLEADRAEAERRAAEARAAAEAQRLEAERAEAERRAAEARAEAERVEAERLATAEAQRLAEADRADAERVAAQARAEAERTDAERRAAEAEPADEPAAAEPAAEAIRAVAATASVSSEPAHVAHALQLDDTKPERRAARAARAFEAVAAPAAMADSEAITMPVAATVGAEPAPAAQEPAPAAQDAALVPRAAPSADSAPTEIADEPSDGVVRHHIATAETAPVRRRQAAPEPIEDDRPGDMTGEITMPRQRPPVVIRYSEPSILVADLGALHAAVSEIAADQAAAPPTADAASPARDAPVAAVRNDATVFSDAEEAFFRAGHKYDRPPSSPGGESFDDLDEGYRRVGFWERLRGKPDAPDKPGKPEPEPEPKK